MKLIFKPTTFILVTTLLLSCISTRKYADYVNQKYNQKNNISSVNDYIEFDNSCFNYFDSIVKTEKIKSSFIPAIFYWQWNNTIKCELSSKQTFMTFNNYFQYYADSLNIKEIINDQKLIVTLESIPKTFVYTNKGFVVFVLVAYSVGGLEAIFPENDKLVFSYKTLNGTTETKSGRIEISNTDIPLKNIWKATKKFTWFYIDQYENNLKKLSKIACEKLENEL